MHACKLSMHSRYIYSNLQQSVCNTIIIEIKSYGIGGNKRLIKLLVKLCMHALKELRDNNNKKDQQMEN